MFIEFHLLQNFAPSNLNRDDTNNPKDCEFGGCRRARISSQCIKRSIRTHPSFAKQTEVEPAERTRFLAREIARLLVEKGQDPKESKLAASNVIGNILGGMDDKDSTRSKVLIFISQKEKDALVDLIQEHWTQATTGEFQKNELEKAIKLLIKSFQNRTSAPGIALFGRMLAEKPDLNIDAAAQVAHAISTHRVNMDFDFFTAVDDLQHEEETGAAMMGVIGFNSACFYRYARVDFQQLHKNLDYDLHLARKTIAAFMRALAYAVPSGKQTSFAAQNPPGFLMAVTREDGMSWSLANAFEKPVFPRREQSLLDASVMALDAYWGSLVDFYGGLAKPVIGLVGIDCEIEHLESCRARNLQAWIDAVLAELPQE